MSENFLAFLPLMRQRQDSLMDQLFDLKKVLERLGFDEATLSSIFERIDFQDCDDNSPLADSINQIPKMDFERLVGNEALVIRAIANRLGLYDASDYIRSKYDREKNAIRFC
ncbi:hypothetical protein Q9L42_020790 (plasmid) [Methylomarinum sp. Ch1-1]|uniref:Uncharacterized protein n=1 Tax=Methylomarinum roseum TaxID=3067653 RepID=A0AAU7P0G4_9GAMM|nr:hypothetical protein [Methylomarinum sp. Ch1-1]MDP4518959.1 hypothetical protein [Methylomarinum sp. Ch1-1]MDP4523357.1 hypothetical protein [Methylomarinum sp. Ch1-1]